MNQKRAGLACIVMMACAPRHNILEDLRQEYMLVGKEEIGDTYVEIYQTPTGQCDIILFYTPNSVSCTEHFYDMQWMWEIPRIEEKYQCK